MCYIHVYCAYSIMCTYLLLLLPSSLYTPVSNWVIIIIIIIMLKVVVVLEVAVAKFLYCPRPSLRNRSVGSFTFTIIIIIVLSSNPRRTSNVNISQVYQTNSSRLIDRINIRFETCSQKIKTNEFIIKPRSCLRLV